PPRAPLFPYTTLFRSERGRINPELVRFDGGSRGGRSNRDRARGRAPQRRSKRIGRSDIARALDETGLLPGIVFVFSRNGCDQARSEEHTSELQSRENL